MIFDIEMIRSFYSSLSRKVDEAREHLHRPMTLAEKILYEHLYDESKMTAYRRGEDYVDFRPDRVAMQDATAQMALLQFMNAGKEQSAVPATVHCDHLIQAYRGAKDDLSTANETNKEVYDFLQSVSGIRDWLLASGCRYHPSGYFGELCFSRRNDGGHGLTYPQRRRLGHDSHRGRRCRCGRCNDRNGMGVEDAEVDRCQIDRTFERLGFS